MSHIFSDNLSYNKGRGFIGLIIVLVTVVLLVGGLYYYLSGQASEISLVEIPETEETPVVGLKSEPENKTNQQLTGDLIPDPPENQIYLDFLCCISRWHWSLFILAILLSPLLFTRKSWKFKLFPIIFLFLAFILFAIHNKYCIFF